ncbi:MAG: hypothetical protein ABWY82_13995, partial [Tardiphaga sp.]
AAWGPGMRRYTWDDGLLADGMRLILGQYQGPDRRLYRGEHLGAYTRGKIGIAWTKHRRVADWFARAKGGVVLETVAPARAILGAVRCGREGEYLVDPRLLVSVTRMQIG